MRPVHRALILLAATTLPASGAVFQYTVPVATEKGESAAFLWIPPETTHVRGAVVAGMTVMEREFAKDARIRHTCADQQSDIL